MTQYINKFVLVAEIEKLKGKVSDGSSYCNGWQHALRMLELELKTLEVKEVDLTKEIAHFALNGGTGDNTPTIGEIAKHFFELGMAVSNKAQKGE